MPKTKVIVIMTGMTTDFLSSYHIFNENTHYKFVKLISITKLLT